MYTIKKNIFLILAGLGQIAFSQQEHATIPRDTTYTVKIVHDKIRNEFPFASPAKSNLPKGVIAHKNLVYLRLKDTPFGDRELKLDLFQPEKKGKYPALIMIHGGGWRAGNKSLQEPMAQQIAAKGYVTVAVEYQLSLEASYPTAIHNIKAAIRWIRANAEKYNIDANRIAISGCSAGGHLAVLTGMTNNMERFEGNTGNMEYSSSVQAVIDVDGVVDFMAPASLNLKRGPNSPDVEWLGGTFIEKPEIWKEASPIFWVNEKSTPVLFINSGFPRFHAGQDEMIGILKEKDIYYERYVVDVKVHPFWLFHPWFETTVNYMASFLDKVFK